MNRVWSVLRAPAVPRKPRVPPSERFVSTDGGRNAACIIEARDCAVRAASIVLGITYAEAHALYKALGRQDGKGTPPWMTAKVLGVEVTHCYRGLHKHPPTFARWAKEHQQGRFVVWVTGHVFAYIDGVQHDNGPGLYKPRARMTGYYRMPDAAPLRLAADGGSQ